MATYRTPKESRFTCLSNSVIKDSRLSDRAYRVITFILYLPNDWSFNVKGLASVIGKSEDYCRRALTELTKLGYIRHSQSRSKDGKFGAAEYDIFEEALPEDSFTVAQKTVHGESVNGKTVHGNLRNILNTNILSTNLLNTKINNNYTPPPCEGSEKELEQPDYEELLLNGKDYYKLKSWFSDGTSSVMLSEYQLEKLCKNLELEEINYYLEKFCSFLTEFKNKHGHAPTVKSHYETIMKWVRQDRGVADPDEEMMQWGDEDAG